MSISAVFASGTLRVFGDNLDNTISISRNAAGSLLVNGGAVHIRGSSATIANTSLIQLYGRAGNDTLQLDETNGALPRAKLYGGDGNDTLIGGSSNDALFGEAGNDTLLGKGGSDFLSGGAGNDVLIGGSGNDQVLGDAGDDRLIWNPGDGTDLNEGGLGTDTVEVNGGNGAENFSVTANSTRVRLDRLDPAPFSLDIGSSEKLVVNLNGGDDTFTAGNGLASLIQLIVDGGAGNDTITGGDGADTLLGGDGNDTIIGGRGNDSVFLGAGDDTFIWNPGDGSDTVEGQAGLDTMQFNGANVSENIDISANGGRLRFFRDIGSVTMDTNEVERVNFAALGGADTITVGDLSGTGVTELNLDLSGLIGSNTGDGQPDTVILNGTNLADSLQILGDSGNVSVLGLSTVLNLKSVEATDALRVNGNGGDDSLSASTLVTPIALTLDGGAGDDTLVGSNLSDVLLGGDGNDVVSGNRGNDIAFLGAGDDVFVWNPGDGSDTVEGQAGRDQLLFNGANISENIDISANGPRVRFSRDVGGVVMDTNDVEVLTFNAFGGSDRVVINDLSGTAVTDVQVNLASSTGSGDGQTDTVVVNGTSGDDVISVLGNGSTAQVVGLAAQVTISGIEPNADQLQINALAGDDVINASGLANNSIRLAIDAGDGNDVAIGSAGNDTILGGAGDDVLIGGDGVDVLDGGTGNNVVIQ